MKLNTASLRERSQWEEKGYVLPDFDIAALRERTRRAPEWIHFGAGNIFRAYIAVLQQRLIAAGSADKGIIVCEGYDGEILEKAYEPFDNLALAVTLKADGSLTKEVVGSLTETVLPGRDWERLEEIFGAPSLQMVSLTITEKGYAVTDEEGNFLPWTEGDKVFSERPAGTIAVIARLLYARFQRGGAPLALVSMDNCSRNGSLLKEAVLTFARGWAEQGAVEPGFLDYLQDRERIFFNWSMIDKITPRPSEELRRLLEEDGLEGMAPVVTAKNSYVAPFVNAEESQYLAVEEGFPNGRPPLEKAGVLFADRETIGRIEKMKVCTCLNPLHTVLAVFGCLLGYRSISEEMKDPLLKAFITRLGYDEGMPVVVDPGVMNAEDFIRDSIEVRFPNPHVPDTPQRIATDTSQKIPVRFGETMKAYVAQGREDLSFLTYIPLFLAGWLRYLTGRDDRGELFTLSPDPNLDKLRPFVSSFFLGYQGETGVSLEGLLTDETYFGVDLKKRNLAPKVEAYFLEMLAGPGAVRRTLEKYIPV